MAMAQQLGNAHRSFFFSSSSSSSSSPFAPSSHSCLSFRDAHSWQLVTAVRRKSVPVVSGVGCKLVAEEMVVQQQQQQQQQQASRKTWVARAVLSPPADAATGSLGELTRGDFPILNQVFSPSPILLRSAACFCRNVFLFPPTPLSA
jgi:hypothetical protein